MRAVLQYSGEQWCAVLQYSGVQWCAVLQYSGVVCTCAARQRVERQGGASGYNCCLPTIPSTDRHVPWLMLIIMIVMVMIMNLMVNMVGLVWFYEEVALGFVL